MKKYGLVFCIITCVLMWVFMLSAWTWTYTYDTDTPLGSASPSIIDDRIRETKDALQERLNVCLYFPLTGTEVSDADAGKIRNVLFQAPQSTPALIDEDEGELYTKDVSNKAELHWIDEDENEIQFTSGGYLNGAVLLADSVDSADYAAGSIDAEHLAADVIDETKIADDGIDSEHYNDGSIDSVHIANLTPDDYAGDSDGDDRESVTFANGLIFKNGYVVDAGNTTTVTFDTVFPTGVVSVVITSKSTVAGDSEPVITTFSTSTVIITDKETNTGYYWMAIGY